MVFIDWFLIILIFGLGVLFVFMVKGFKNPVVKHKVPSNLPFLVKEVTIPTKKNKKLYAWWIPVEPQAPIIIFIHGWGRNSQRMLTYLKKFCCFGVNMLAFDARGHGNSEPDGYANLFKFAEDIISCMNFLEKQPEVNNPQFFLVGLSIGGAASIYAAGNDNRIKKVVTVGAFAHPKAVMNKQFKESHIPYFPLVWLLYKYLKVFLKLDLEAIAPEKHISHSGAQFLLIHGEQDKTVPLEQGKRLKNAAGDKAELWAIPGRGHSDCHLEPGFWNRLQEFFNLTETKKQKP